jgi:Calcineurin-like phosphoesterase
MRLAAAAMLMALGLASPAMAKPPLTAWVQMTGAGAEVRAVAEGEACPVLTIDGKARPMALRAAPDEAFPNRICEAALPHGARAASVEGAALPLPKTRPQRLVILGDSGCRLKGKVVQNCNDPVAGWPFAKVAALAAAQKPDLVIHVGDYYYRETPCPDGDAGCAGSPYGDRWPSWKAELFDPAAGLLKAAPWVFARGNHEDCSRGGKGWFRLLDTAPEARACPAHSDTFLVDIGGVTLGVLDSADPDDTKSIAAESEAFANDLKALAAAKQPVWLVTHRPLWEVFRTGPLLTDTGGNVNERQAAKAQGLGRTELVVAGHLHTFYSLDFGVGRPGQLVVGTGGDVLDSTKAAAPVQATVQVDGAPATIFDMDRFGYFVFDRVGGGAADDWKGVFRDLTDAVIANCALHAGRMTCVIA